MSHTNKSYDYVYDANGNALKYETPKLKDLTQNNMVVDTESDRLTERKNPMVNQSEKYSKTYTSPYQSEKYYYWSGGQIIAEGDTQRGDYTVRYIYSGNQKVAMVRKDATGTAKLYYFINNAQGTPVMITNDQGATVSKIAMDEWGNLNQVEYGNLNEVNYTGKKTALSEARIRLCRFEWVSSQRELAKWSETNTDRPATGLYYFNQRYYDPRSCASIFL